MRWVELGKEVYLKPDLFISMQIINQSLLNTAAGLPIDYKISSELEAAIKRYEKLSDSRNLRLLKSANAGIDKLAEYFNDVDFLKLDINGKVMYDPKDFITNVGNLAKVIEGLEKLEEAVLKDEGQESGTRGGNEKGRLS